MLPVSPSPHYPNQRFAHRRMSSVVCPSLSVGRPQTLWDSYAHLVAEPYANAFYDGVSHKSGLTEKQLKIILADVHRYRLQLPFNQILARRALMEGKPVRDASQLIKQAHFKNPAAQFFKRAQQNEWNDYLNSGKNRYRSTAWEYRRNGMWQSLADFGDICKQHPVMSTGVIGSVAYLGHRYPFLGGVSGIAIIVWGSIASLLAELKAHAPSKSASEKAELYTRSGENMMAALITAIGYKGIQGGTLNGIKAFQRDSNFRVQAPFEFSQLQRFWKATGQAIKAELPKDRKLSLSEAVLFVSGLFDNVLLPFNAVADYLQKPKNKT